MDVKRRYTELGYGFATAVAIILIVAAVYPTTPPTIEYDVTFASGAASLPETQSTTATAPSNVPLAFVDAPYEITATLAWTATGGPTGPETLTATLLDPAGNVVTTSASTTSPLTILAPIATPPATMGPYEAESVDQANADAADVTPEGEPATSGWTIQVSRQPSPTGNPAQPATTWTLNVGYTTYAPEATNAVEVDDGSSKAAAVLNTTIVLAGIIAIWAIVVVVMQQRFERTRVEGWDRESKKTSYKRIHNKE